MCSHTLFKTRTNKIMIISVRKHRHQRARKQWQGVHIMIFLKEWVRGLKMQKEGLIQSGRQLLFDEIH
jgi:hypothetical protein